MWNISIASKQAVMLALLCTLTAVRAAVPVESLTFNGQADTNQASFTLTGRWPGGSPEQSEPKLIYSLATRATVQWEATNVTQRAELQAKILQGKLKELIVALHGDGEITNVAGANLKDWAVRFDGAGRKYLVVRPQEQPTNAPPLTNFTVTLTARHPFAKLPLDFTPLSYQAEQAAFTEGTLEIRPHDTVELSLTNITGLMLVRTEAAVGPKTTPMLAPNQPYQFRFTSGDYRLLVRAQERDADRRRVAWENFQLAGVFKDRRASFTLKGEAIVRHPEGGTLAVLAGNAALTSFPTNAEVMLEDGRYVLRFAKAGTYPFALEFDARVELDNEWNSVNFEVASSSLRPVVLKGLPADTQFQFIGAANPERQGDDFGSFLPSAGRVQLQWKTAKKAELGRLFYAVQGTVHMSVGPGLLRQAYLMDYKVMQGELTQLVFDLTGEGEVTRIRGNDILSWKVEPAANNQRRLIVQLNQPRKDNYQIVIQTQTPLGVFPLAVTPPRLAPVQAIRYGGYLAVVNDGAVRLEVTESQGLSQISPELFPKSKELAEAGLAAGTQAFAYRFSGGDYALALRTEHILPELSVSQLQVCHLGETETTLTAELELEIRDAPLRELTLRVPSDFGNARVNAQQISDPSPPLMPEPGTNYSRLRVIFSTPQTGRQVIQVSLSKNTNAAPGAWTLPVIQPVGVKSLRLHLGVSADTGFRLTAGRITGLTEIAPGFFPRKVTGLQLAWRLRDEAWEAVVNVERLAQTVQADALHLFTLKEGMAYGSSLINYWVGGAPINQFRVVVPTNYSNIEFSGRDVRNWKPTTNGYEVYLNTPAFGAFTLLATYDRQFNTRSNNIVAFEAAVPLDAQTEQGTVLVVSEFQFDLRSVEVSPNLLQLDPREISPEHRLLFDAPILAAYQYTTRPYTLRLALNSLPPGETMRQVADRAMLTTHVTREGEVATTARYYVKNQGYAHLRVTLPAGCRLWEARVNDQKTAPVTDGQATLIPLPPKADPTAILTVELKLAAKSADKKLVPLATPTLQAPVLQTEWRIEADAKQRLLFSAGGLSPVEHQQVNTGYAWIRQLIDGRYGEAFRNMFLAIPLLLLLAMVALRWATREGLHRWSAANTLGSLAGWAIGLGAMGMLICLAIAANQRGFQISPNLTFIAPILEAGKPLAVEIKNLPADSRVDLWASIWPALPGVALWLYLAVAGVAGPMRKLGVIAGWTLVAWAALRSPNGAPVFMGLVILFSLIHLLIPALRCQLRLPPKPAAPATPETPATPPATGAAAVLLMAALILAPALASAAGPADEAAKSVVRSVVQNVQVREGFATFKARLIWQAEAGQRLDFLTAPAVLTKIQYPQNSLTLIEVKTGAQASQRLVARTNGLHELVFEYQMAVPKETAAGNFPLPTPAGLVNRLTLEIERPELEVYSTEAVSVETTHLKRGTLDITRAEVVLAPRPLVQIGWRPRARDPRLEAAVFYGELYHLYMPTPGVLEGAHLVQIKPAQGQLSEVSFTVPGNLTITDAQGEGLANWRFDPDQKLLRITLATPQSKPFNLILRSQLATGALPYEQSAGVITLAQAAGQLGMVGVATGNEVQLDTTKEQSLSLINLEDFPAVLVAEAAKPMPGLTLRRAFRYAAADARITLAASAVQPEVRVTSQETLSLGEDRAVLASKLTVNITRAGIFRLSFLLPPDYEVEKLTGNAMSHWTELRTGNERVVTLHLRGKTEGQQTFDATLIGPGMANKKELATPRLILRENNKQSGQLVIVPEQGLRLHVKTRDGVNLLDPRRVGITQKGVMAFSLLHAQWQLAFDVETVEPWIEAALLQDVSLREGKALVVVNLDYRIDNAGIKSLVLQVPANADNVRFEGDLYSDAVRQPETAGSRWRDWEVKLQRRVIGTYALRLTYQLPVTNQAAEVRVTGVKARTANLQRAYLALHSSGRIQLRFTALPAGLQPVEWQAIPASLRRGKDLQESKDCFTVLEGDFELAIGLSRHEVAKLLAAQVESLNLLSVIAPSGEMLTEGRLQVRPGDKRLLRLKLPAGSRFWYAFVNGQSAWPWQESGQILLLLDKHTDPKQPTSVEFFYTCPTGSPAIRKFSHQVLGPAFDLPLENITWNVYVPANWQIDDWQSALQLSGQGPAIWPASINVGKYLDLETSFQKQKAAEAEKLYNMGNTLLQSGAPQQARRAFQAAWNTAPQDAAFNEDARVQLHNVRLQQALIGINERRQTAFDYADAKAGRGQSIFTRIEPGQAPEYTQQQAQQVLEQNAPDENAALYRVAERFLRQQSAATAKPESIRAALPVQGRQYTFTGSLLVNEWADMSLNLAIKQNGRRAWTGGGLFLAGLFVALLIFIALPRDPSKMSGRK